MTLKQLKRKYLAEGVKLGYKKALNEVWNANFYDKSSSFDFDADDEGDSYTGNTKRQNNNTKRKRNNMNIPRENEDTSTKHSVEDIKKLLTRIANEDELYFMDGNDAPDFTDRELDDIQKICPGIFEALTNAINADGDLAKNSFNNISCCKIITQNAFDYINEEQTSYGGGWFNSDPIIKAAKMFDDLFLPRKTKSYSYYFLRNVPCNTERHSFGIFVFLEKIA